MGIGRKLKRHWNKYGKRVATIAGLAAAGALTGGAAWGAGLGALAGGALGTAAGGMVDAQHESGKKLEKEQEEFQQQQLEQAQRQASIAAGNVQQTSEAGTEDALSKILKKRSALQRSIRTGGQQRLGD